MRIIILLTTFVVVSVSSFAQSKGPWKNKQCAVVLTYDDALNIHLDQVIPALDSVGLKGTFYLSVSYPGSTQRINDWRAAAARGHELGNHTMYHPCEGGRVGREWVNPDYDLRKYTITRLHDEIRMTNSFLQSVDGKFKRTFAYPCGDINAGDTSYIESIKGDFIAARGVNSQYQFAGKIDFFNVGAFMMNGASGEEMIELVKKAMEQKALIVFLFHGVGGEHPLNVSRREHSKLIHFLQQHQKDIWVAPFIDVMDFAKK